MTDRGIFVRRGVTWTRAWIGNNGGHYEWMAAGGRLRVVQAASVYRVIIDGRLIALEWPRLITAMDEAVRLRGR